MAPGKAGPAVKTRLIIVAGGAVAALALVGAALFVARPWPFARPAATVATGDAGFQRLLAERHTIERVEFFGWNADSGTVGVTVRGTRRGAYKFAWEITGSAKDLALESGGRTVTLDPGRRTIVIAFDLGRLAAAYREMGLFAAGAGPVTETLRLTASLEPVPGPTERAVLSPSELQDLGTGHSSLRHVGVGAVPATLHIPSEPTQSTD